MDIIIEIFELHLFVDLFWMIVNMYVVVAAIVALLVSIACLILSGVYFIKEFKDMIKNKALLVFLCVLISLFCCVFATPIMLLCALTHSE